MVLRIHFTAEDLVRTRVAATADPLWEVLLSGFRLHDRDAPLEYRPWLRQIQARQHTRQPRSRAGAHLLSVLAPLGSYIPDFLTPDDARHGIDAGLEAIRATPRARLRREMLRLADRSPLPDWIRPLAEGDKAFLAWFTDELRRYHDSVITPCQDLVQGSIDADQARRARDLLHDGVEGLFEGLRPAMRWLPPVLEVDYAVDQDLHLRGRGLRLVPSFFSRGNPDSLADPDLSPVLVYPLDMETRWATITSVRARGSLAALVGATRAAVLHAVDPGATTTALAARLGTSPSSVSRHTTVLRNSGLIATHRHGTAVLHTLTPLGRGLLDQDG